MSDEWRKFDGALAPDDRWFISRDGKAKQQLSAAEIIELCRTNAVSANTLVWHDGLTDWTSLGEVPELAQALRAFSRGPAVPAEPPLAMRPSLPSIPPPPSLPPKGSSVQPQRAASSARTSRPSARIPSIIVNEKAISDSPEIPSAHPPGTAWSMLTLQEAYSVLLPGGHRVGVWTLAICAAVFCVGTALGAIIFGGGEDQLDAEPVSVDLDEAVSGASAADAEQGERGAANDGDAVVIEEIDDEGDEPKSNTSAVAGDAPRPGAANPGESGGGERKPASAGKAQTTPASATREVKAADKPKLTSTIDKAAVNRVLASAAAKAASCEASGAAKGSGQVKVLFTPAGKVQAASVVTAKFRGTSTASCVEDAFRRVTIPAYQGKNVSALKSFTVR